MVGNAAFATVAVAHQCVGGHADPRRIHPELGQQSGLHNGDEARSGIGYRLDQDNGVECVRQPVPVLPDQDWAARSDRGEAGTLGGPWQLCAGRPRLGREHDLGPDVDREDIVERYLRALGDPRELVQVPGAEVPDRLDEPAGLGGRGRPVPPRVVSEYLAIRRDRLADLVWNLRAVLPPPLSGVAFNVDHREHTYLS